jgi:hypothetical protein
MIVCSSLNHIEELPVRFAIFHGCSGFVFFLVVVPGGTSTIKQEEVSCCEEFWKGGGRGSD